MTLSDFHQQDEGDKKTSWADDDDFQPSALRNDEQPKQSNYRRDQPRDQNQQPREQNQPSQSDSDSNWRTQTHRQTGSGRFNNDNNNSNYERRDNRQYDNDNNDNNGGENRGYGSRRGGFSNNRDDRYGNRPQRSEFNGEGGRGGFRGGDREGGRGGFRGGDREGNERTERSSRPTSAADVDDDWRKRDPEQQPQPSQTWGASKSRSNDFGSERNSERRPERRENREPREPRQQHPIPTEPPFIAYVGNLDYSTQEEDLQNFFKHCNLKEIRIARTPDRNPKGFAYAEFNDVEGLKEALSYTGADFLDRKILIDVAEKRKSREEKEGSRPSKYGFGNRDNRDNRGFGNRDNRDNRDNFERHSSPKQSPAQAPSSEGSPAPAPVKKSNPFGNAKPVDSTAALKKIEDRVQHDREEINKKVEEEKARKDSEKQRDTTSSSSPSTSPAQGPAASPTSSNTNNKRSDNKNNNAGKNKQQPSGRENSFSALSTQINN